MKIYRGTDGDVKPVIMECDKFGWPHKTTCGETMWDNAHYRTELEAWESIIASVYAGVSLAESSVRRCERHASKARKDLFDATQERVKALVNYDSWEAKQPELEGI